MMFICECFSRFSIVETVLWIAAKPHLFLLGCLLVLGLVALFFALTRNTTASIAIVGTPLIALAGINALMGISREHPSLPPIVFVGLDFFRSMFKDWVYFGVSIGIVALIGFIVFLIVKYTHKRRPDMKKSIRALVAPAGAAALAVSMLLCSILPSDVNNVHERLAQNGYLTTFADYLLTPYIEDSAEYIVPEYKAQGGSNTPDIIVVKLESFSDGNDYLKLSEDATPNLHRLSNEGISGKIMVTAFGGNTCTTCFDVLTGYSTAFTTPTTSFYGDVLMGKEHQKSFAHTLKEQGYATEYISSYFPNFSNEKNAVTAMGFDRFVSDDEFEYDTAYISDRLLTEKIISEYENRDTAKPLFMTALTMENHFPFFESNYEELDFDYEENEMLTTGENNTVRDYLNGIHDDDELIGALTDYFSKCENEVDIIFFSDHRPIVGFDLSVYKKLGEIREDFSYKTITEDELEFLYGVPYLIWSNKGGLEQVDNKAPISPSYLMPILFEQKGINGGDVSDFLNEARRHVDNFGTASFKPGEYDKLFTDYYRHLCYKDIME